MPRTPNKDPQLSFLPGEHGMLQDSRAPGQKTGKRGGRKTAAHSSIAERIRGAAMEAMDDLDMVAMIKQSFEDDFLATLQALARWKPAEVQLSGSVSVQDAFIEMLRNDHTRRGQHVDGHEDADRQVAPVAGDVRH